MKKDFWRQSAVAMLAVGLLAASSGAQEGATGEVKIEGETPPAATATAAVKPAAKPVKPTITDRDPFVNHVNAGVVSSGSVRRVRNDRASGNTVKPAAAAPKAAAATAAKGAAAGTEEEVPEVIVPAPEVTITGIVKSRGGNQAIVSTGSSSYIVATGQKLGDYRVAAITDTAVTFTHTGKSFKIPIESEFGLKK